MLVTARTPWARYYFDRTWIGEEARWWMSSKRPDGIRREVMGEVRIAGRWPFGVKLFAIPDLHFIRIGPLAELGGLLLTAWAVAHIIRHPRK